MSTVENKDFIRRYLEAISGQPKTRALSDLFIAEEPLKQHIEAAETAFPLYLFIPIEIIAEGDLVCVQAKLQGIHNGPFMGIPATGRPVNFDVFITYRVAEGKIIDHWMLSDNMVLMQQLGILPPPPQA